MKKLLFSFFLYFFCFFTSHTYAAQTPLISPSSGTGCSASNLLTLNYSVSAICGTPFSATSFDISSIPDGQNLKSVEVKFWINNPSQDNTVHYTPQLEVNNTCIVNGSDLEPTISNWQEMTRVFDISSCNLTSSTDIIQKVTITGNSSSNHGVIDYIGLKVTYEAPTYSLNDKTSNGNNLTNVGATKWITDTGFGASTHTAKMVRSSNQYLTTPDSASLSITQDLTMEAWVKLDSLPTGINNSQTIASKYSSTGTGYSYLWTISTNGSGTLGMYLGIDNSGGASPTFLHKAYSFSTNTWYHVAVVYDASAGEAEFFVNGSTIGTVSGFPTAIFDSTSPFVVGAFNTNTGGVEFFDGKIDEVRVWNTTRTGTQINNNKSVELTGSESGLVAYYPLESDVPQVGYTANDQTTNMNNLVNNGTTEWSVDAGFGASTEAVKLVRSSNQYLTTPDSSSLSITGDLTMEAWVKMDSIPGGTNSAHTILGKYSSTGTGYSYLWAIGTNGSGTLGMFLGIDGTNGSSPTFVQQAYTFSTNTWYHVAVVYDASAGSAEFFVNGSSVGTKTGLPTSIFDSNSPLTIGTFATDIGGVEFWDGKIDEVRVWNTDRTSSQINNNMNTELSGNESGLVVYYPFETPAPSPEYDLTDKSAYGLHLTNYGTTQVKSSLPMADSYYATDFEASSNQYLTAPDGNSLNQPNLAVEAWVNFESLPASGSAMSFVEKKDAFGFHLWNDSGTYKLRITQGANEASTAWTPSTGVWYHVAVNYEPNTPSYIKFYIDGVQQGSTINSPGFAGSTPDNSNLLYIGAKESGGGQTNYLDGVLDEVRIWSSKSFDTEVSANKDIELSGSSTLDIISALYTFETY